jgi:hypothetical protein
MRMSIARDVMRILSLSQSCLNHRARSCSTSKRAAKVSTYNISFSYVFTYIDFICVLQVFDDRVKQKITPEQFQELLMKQAAELDAELDAELAQCKKQNGRNKIGSYIVANIFTALVVAAADDAETTSCHCPKRPYRRGPSATAVAARS